MASGRVSVAADEDGAESSGAVVLDASFQVLIGAETVLLDGARIPRPFQRVIALHKPVGCDSSSRVSARGAASNHSID